MHKYKAIIFTIFLFFTTSYAMYEDYWSYNQTITLSKDDYFSANVKRDALNKELHIKWTLYINNLLTMQVNLDKFNHQFNLKLSPNEASFKLPLLYKRNLERESPYLIIKFLEYDYKKHTAKFDLFMRNPSKDITLTRGNI